MVSMPYGRRWCQVDVNPTKNRVNGHCYLAGPIIADLSHGGEESGANALWLCSERAVKTTLKRRYFDADTCRVEINGQKGFREMVPLKVLRGTHISRCMEQSLLSISNYPYVYVLSHWHIHCLLRRFIYEYSLLSRFYLMDIYLSI